MNPSPMRPRAPGLPARAPWPGLAAWAQAILAPAALAFSALISFALLTAAPAHAAPADFELVTEAEAREDQVAAQLHGLPPRTRGLPRLDAPAIRVLNPTAAAMPVAAPLRIEAAFEAAPGTRIVPTSFRLLYGLLKIDLTERLRDHARVSEGGVVISGARVPNGQHRMFLQVADDKGSTTEHELRLRVADAH